MRWASSSYYGGDAQRNQVELPLHQRLYPVAQGLPVAFVYAEIRAEIEQGSLANFSVNAFAVAKPEGVVALASGGSSCEGASDIHARKGKFPYPPDQPPNSPYAAMLLSCTIASGRPENHQEPQVPDWGFVPAKWYCRYR